MELPWKLAIFLIKLHWAMYELPFEGNIDYRCGGSLISKNYVLTASHCLTTSKVYNPVHVVLGKVSLGDTDLDGEEPLKIRIKKIILHPDYKSSNAYNDIALIELEEPVPAYSKVLKPACLYTDINDIDPNVLLHVTGWGVYQKNGRITSKLLLKGEMKCVDRNSCRSVYGERLSIPEGINSEQICASDRENGEVDACNGDSGKI